MLSDCLDGLELSTDKLIFKDLFCQIKLEVVQQNCFGQI